MRRPTFDPADHLAKQGWKGKGTALRDGHAKRPIAVVQKKSLSGIGKDRDEAVPFWDHIFASTAATLSSNASPSASGTSTPVTKPVISIAARSGKELARRKLYSSFLRGSVQSTPLPSDEETESEAAVEKDVTEVESKDKGKGKSRDVSESKEERRARKLERRAKKEAKLAARAAKAERKALKAAKSSKSEKGDKAERRAKREARRAARVHSKA